MVLLGSSWVRSKRHFSVTLMGLLAAPRRMRFEKHSLNAPAEVDNVDIIIRGLRDYLRTLTSFGVRELPGVVEARLVLLATLPLTHVEPVELAALGRVRLEEAPAREAHGTRLLTGRN